jgi:heat shock protein HslJ
MPIKRIAQTLAVLAVGLTFGCARSSALPEAIDGRWDVQQIAGASLGEGVRINIDIDARQGRMSGFTGCNGFSAPVSAFGQMITIGAVREDAGDCPSAAAATDEARFLMVLGSVARYARNGRSLELLPREHGEALLRLRFSDAQEAAGN